MILFVVVVVLIMACIAVLCIPNRVVSRFSAIEREFDVTLEKSSETFTLEELEGYPEAMRKFFINGGFIGRPKPVGLKAFFPATPFSLGLGKEMVTIDYTQLNRIDRIERYAQIRSTIKGVPFDGLGSFKDGKGSMKGYLMKFIRIFNQTGDYMDRACLATFLAEAFFLPTIALSDAITYEEIDPLYIRATMKAYGLEVSGLFTFDEEGRMLSFHTTDRAASTFDGNVEQVPWTAECGDYTWLDGVWVPTRLRAIWHYPGEDLVYFDGKNAQVRYY